MYCGWKSVLYMFCSYAHTRYACWLVWSEWLNWLCWLTWCVCLNWLLIDIVLMHVDLHGLHAHTRHLYWLAWSVCLRLLCMLIDVVRMLELATLRVDWRGPHAHTRHVCWLTWSVCSSLYVAHWLTWSIWWCLLVRSVCSNSRCWLTWSVPVCLNSLCCSAWSTSTCSNSLHAMLIYMIYMLELAIYVDWHGPYARTRWYVDWHGVSWVREAKKTVSRADGLPFSLLFSVLIFNTAAHLFRTFIDRRLAAWIWTVGSALRLEKKHDYSHHNGWVWHLHVYQFFTFPGGLVVDVFWELKNSVSGAMLSTKVSVMLIYWNGNPTAHQIRMLQEQQLQCTVHITYTHAHVRIFLTYFCFALTSQEMCLLLCVR